MFKNDTPGFNRLQSVIEALIERLKMLSGKEGGEALQFATDVSGSVLGSLLDPETHASLDDQQADDLSMRIEGYLVVFDLISTVFLVEKLKMMSGMEGKRKHWMSIHLVSDICVSALEAHRSSNFLPSFDAKQLPHLFELVEEVLTTIGSREGDPLLSDLLPEIIKRHQG